MRCRLFGHKWGWVKQVYSDGRPTQIIGQRCKRCPEHQWFQELP